MKRKRGFRAFCGTFLALTVFFAGQPVQPRAQAFSDVPSGIWYAAAVEDLVDRGIMKGKDPDTFAPQGDVTRAEFVTMLARTALGEGELNEYNYKGPFSDVWAQGWANKYINWVSEAGITSGAGGGRFNPDRLVTRQDMAVLIVNYANAMGLELPAVRPPRSFKDGGSISSYAKSAVDKCSRAGVINGDDNGNFRPGGYATRAEAASMYSRFLSAAQSAGYDITRKRMNGTAITAVHFDPYDYDAYVGLGRDNVHGAEGAPSLFDRVGAKIAVNAAFFNFDTYEPFGTIVDAGRIITTYNRFSPAKTAIVMDFDGRFSIENFSLDISAKLRKPDGTETTATQLGVNRYPSGSSDGTRLIYTSDWGDRLGFSAKYAAVVSEDGTVLDVYHDSDVTIPYHGYVLAQRGPRQYDNFLPKVEEGDYIELDTYYNGSSTQDIYLAIGVGPKLVQHGSPYGDSGTYAAEGLSEIGGYGDARRVCIGVRYDGSLVILTAYASLPELSSIMVAMGCESAVNLDGGGSTNLYVNGRWLYGPTDRALNSVLYFK